MTMSTPADLSLRLDDGVTAYAPTGGGTQTGYGTVDGVSKIYDTGAAALWKGTWAVNVTTIDKSSLDEAYTFVVQGSNSSTFASGVQDLALVNLAVVQQYVNPLTNQYSTTFYRYLRLKKVVSGTTPSIKALVFIQPLSALDTYTLQEVLTTQAVIAQNQSNVTTNFSQWANGIPTGGPNSDGSYVLTDFNGGSTLVPSPQKLVNMFGSCTNISLATSIATTSVPTGVNLIKTNGYRVEGLGGAYYVAVSTAPTTGYKGTRWFQTSNNRYFVLVKDQIITPFMFGAYGDGSNHAASLTFATLTDLQVLYPFASSLTQEMDNLAWQAALYFGGHIQSNAASFIMMNSNNASQTPLTAIAGTFDVDAAGSTFSFSSMTEQVDATQYILNSTFSSSSNWSNATQYGIDELIPTTFGSGYATMTDISAKNTLTIRTSAADSSWNGVCWSSSLSLYCAVGSAGAVMTSPDGITWTSRTAASSNDWQAICWSPALNLFVAIANTGTGNRVMTSPNGTTWTSRTSASDSDWRSICWSPSLSLFVAVSNSGTTSGVMTSSNGTTWTSRTTPNTNTWRAVCWSPELALFVATSTSGTGNRVMTSTNGTTWVAQTSAADNNWVGVCWSPGLSLFCAVATSGTGNRVMTSTNGTTWVAQTSAVDNNWRSVCWSAEKSMFCTVSATGTGDRCMTSKNGTTWRIESTPADNNWFSVCSSSNPKQFCAVATSGTGNRVMTGVVYNGFYQWGQQVTLSAGRYTLTMNLEATIGDSYALGNVQPPYGSVNFFSSAIGSGTNPTGKSADVNFNVFLPGGVPDTKTITFDFTLASSTTMWLTFNGGGYANIKCSLFGIKKWLSNCAILSTRDGSPQHYPIPRGFKGFEIIGPGYGTNVSAIKFKSFENTDGNLISFTDCSIHDFGKGISFGDGAYLTEFRNCSIYNMGTALYTELGTLNAGENLRFYGGGIFNSGIAIDGQGGMEISLYGTAFDYCGQMVVNAVGRYELHGVHCETRTPTDEAYPTFHLIGGRVIFYGGMYLGANTPLTSPCAPVKTEFSTALLAFYGTEIYNLSSDPSGIGKGAMIEGPGQLITNGWINPGNPNIGPLVVSYAPVHDTLSGAGKFPESNAYTQDPNNILLEGGAYPDIPGQIPFTGSTSGSILTITSTPPFAITEGSILKGVGVKGKPIISYIPSTGGTGYTGTYLISIPQNLSSRSLTAGQDGQVDRWNTTWGSLEWSDDYTNDGSNSLKFTKNNDGLNSSLRFLIPVTPRSVSLGIVSFLFPVDYSPVDPTATVPLYYRLYWVRSIGQDDYKRPIIIKELFAGETDLVVPRAGSSTWQLRSLSTTYNSATADESLGLSAYAPEWATHLGVYVDTQSLPAGQVFYMSNLISNLLR